MNRVSKRLGEMDDTHYYDSKLEIAKRFREFLPELKELSSYELPKIPSDDMDRSITQHYEYIDQKRKRLERVIQTARDRIEVDFSVFVKQIEESIHMTKAALLKIGLNIYDTFDDYQRKIYNNVSMTTESEEAAELFSIIPFYRPLQTYIHCGALQNSHNYLIRLYKTMAMCEIKKHLRYAFANAMFTEKDTKGYNSALERRLGSFTDIMNRQLLAYSDGLSYAWKLTNTQYFRFCDLQQTPWIKVGNFFNLSRLHENGNSQSSLQDKRSSINCFVERMRIYLGRLESREFDNYVVVGIRLNRNKKVSLHFMNRPDIQCKVDIFYLQPMQGKLNPDGTITNEEWVPLPDPVFEGDTAIIDLDHRSFFFDDLQLDPEYVVTGIKFDAVERANGIKGFSISVSGKSLDYKTGKLNFTIGNKKYIRPSETGIEKRLIYKLEGPKPVDFIGFRNASSGNSTYVTIENYGEHTLPVFDATEVVMERLSPLSGIAVFHSGMIEKNSGFISFQIRPLDYLPFIEDMQKKYCFERFLILL